MYGCRWMGTLIVCCCRWMGSPISSLDISLDIFSLVLCCYTKVFMMTSCNIMPWKHFPHYWPFVRGNHLTMDQYYGALIITLMLVCTNCSINSLVTSASRCHDGSCDVTIMFLLKCFQETWMCLQGAVSIRKTVLPGMAIPMLKIRRPNGRLIFNIGITIPR